MNGAVSGAAAMAMFMLVTVLVFQVMDIVWNTQVFGHQEFTRRLEERQATAVDLESTSDTATDCLTYTATVANTGETVVTDFTEMDIFVQYTDSGDSQVVSRLVYTTDWTVSMSPDDRDPNAWNPDETATITFSVISELQSGSKGTIIVVTPLGIVDSAYFDGSSVPCVDYYLHNFPTPPIGPTASQADLPLTSSGPTVTTLYNYDTDRDLIKGLLIEKGGVGATEPDPIKYQAWQTEPLASALTINGAVTIDFWSAIKDYQLSIAGEATFFLRDYDGVDYVEIGNGTLSAADWQGGVSDFVFHSLSIPGVNYTIPLGNRLEVKLIVEATSGDDMWFAYDTTAHKSLVDLP